MLKELKKAVDAQDLQGVEDFYTSVTQLSIMEQYYYIKAFQMTSKAYFSLINRNIRVIIKNILNSLYVQKGETLPYSSENAHVARAGMGNLDDYIKAFKAEGF